MTRVKQRTYKLLYGSQRIQWWLAALIIVNALAMMLETIASLGSRYTTVFAGIEMVSVVLFTLEYSLRIWVADIFPEHHAPIKGRLRYALTPMALIDLLAILPSLLALSGIDLRILRILRLFRLLKLTRHAKALTALMKAISTRRDEIAISALFMLLLMLISSSLIYYAEHEAQPNIYSSIPAAWWWSVSTLATIGYGDIYPITIPGKITAAITAIFGIGLFALPGGIIASSLLEQASTSSVPCCPQCGNTIKQ